MRKTVICSSNAVVGFSDCFVCVGCMLVFVPLYTVVVERFSTDFQRLSFQSWKNSKSLLVVCKWKVKNQRMVK